MSADNGHPSRPRRFWFSVLRAGARGLWWLLFVSVAVHAADQMAGASGLVALVAIGLVFGVHGVTVVCHELGHVLAAWAVGFRVYRVRVGPWIWTPQLGGVQWSSERSDYGGWVDSGPPFDAPRRTGEMIVCLGGVAANALLAAGGLGCAVALAPMESTLHAFPLLVAADSVRAIVVSLFPPSWFNLEYNDGSQFRRARAEPEPSRRTRAFQTLYQLHMAGVPHHEWPLEAVEELIASAPPEGVYEDYWVGSYAMATGNWPTALTYLSRYVAAFPDQAPAIAPHLALVMLLNRGSVREARRWLDRVPDGEIRQGYFYLRAEAILSYLESRTDDARDVVKRAREAMQREGIDADPDATEAFDAIENGLPLARYRDKTVSP